MPKKSLILTIFILNFIFFYKTITFFSVLPNKFIPRGQTIVIFKNWNNETNKFFPKFIDNSDELCKRALQDKKLAILPIFEIEKTLCRGIILSAVTKSTLLVMLPFSRIFHKITVSFSTN